MAIIGIDASRAVSTTPTGTEAYSFHLIRALLPHLRAHQVRLYVRVPTLPETFPGAEIRVIPFPRLWTHLRLSWELLRHPVDLLFVPAHVLPLYHPRRSLVTIHDVGYRFFPEAHPLLQRLYLAWSTGYNARTAARVIAVSHATREALATSYGIPHQKVHVIPNGYTPDLKPVRDPHALYAVRQKYGIPGDYILYLGRLQPRKNLPRLIRAFGRIAGDYPDLSLVLAGPGGWLEQSIHEAIAACHLETRVLLPGYIAADDKAALLSGARVFAFPSLYEGFGIPVLEAQACEVPVLTSTTSSLPEVAGDAAVLVDPTDELAIAEGLRRLLEDAALCETLRARGRANVARFSWESAARQTAALIEAMLTGLG